MLLHTLRDLAEGRAERQAQPAEGVSYAHKIDKAEAPIDWRQDAAAIERRVRAFDPFPGASFQWQGETHKLWRAALRSTVPRRLPAACCRPLPGTLARGLRARARWNCWKCSARAGGASRSPPGCSRCPTGALAPGLVLSSLG